MRPVAQRIALPAVSVMICGLVGCGSGTAKVALAPDVYLAGFQVNGSFLTATYWKNGVATELTAESVGSQAKAIAVSQGNIYVAGFEAQSSQDVATLWTNGTKTLLTDGTTEGVATGVAVSGSDVYVSGYEIGYDANLNHYQVAEYWKNGVPVILDKSMDGAATTGIYVSGGDVYVSGSKFVTTQTGPATFLTESVAMYWKNGAPILLTSGLFQASASSIFVTGSDVYASGSNCVVFAPDCGEAVYWKNGVLGTC
jgi:hypothetical protein